LDLGPDIENSIFLNLNRYLLYLVFENIQNILNSRTDKQWTNSVVLDAVILAVQSFRKSISNF